jgi:uncharacterized membrane protein (UPF0127 family)
MAWLLREGEVLASLELAEGRRARSRGLLGRDGLDGALLLERTRSVHTVGMRFPIDVAVCDGDLVVLRTRCLPPGRVTLPVRHGRQVIEAEAGSFARWELAAGDRLEVRP